MTSHLFAWLITAFSTECRHGCVLWYRCNSPAIPKRKRSLLCADNPVLADFVLRCVEVDDGYKLLQGGFGHCAHSCEEANAYRGRAVRDRGACDYGRGRREESKF
jgi:hypothetical protein